MSKLIGAKSKDHRRTSGYRSGSSSGSETSRDKLGEIVETDRIVLNTLGGGESRPGKISQTPDGEFPRGPPMPSDHESQIFTDPESPSRLQV